MSKKKYDNIAQKAVESFVQSHGGYTVEDVRQNLRGIPVGNLALEWALDSNIWYLGFTYMLVGEWGSGKTQMVFQMMRRFLDHDPNAIAFFLPTEGKDTASQADTLLGPHALGGRYAMIPASLMTAYSEYKKKSMSELDNQAWSTIVFNLLTELKEYPHPVIIGLDSIVGAIDEESKNTIEEAKGSIGSRNTHGMTRANTIKQFLTWLSGELAGTKITFVFTNHGKKKVEVERSFDRGQIDKYWPGGNETSARPNTIIYMTRGAALRTKEHAGSTSWIRTYKNSNGASDRYIGVDHYYEVARDAAGNVVLDAAGHPMRAVVWDWDRATCDLLCRLFQPGLKDNLGPAAYKDVASIVKTGTSVNPLYTIKAWGLKEASPREVVEFLHADTDESRAIMLAIMSLNQAHTVHNTVYVPE